MSQHPPMSEEDFLHVAWDPTAARLRVAVARRRFVAGIIGLVVTLLVLGGLYWWSHRGGEGWAGTGQWTLAGVVVGLSVVLLVVRAVAWRIAVRQRRRIGEGEVVTASWAGIQIAGHYWDWDRVGPVATRRGGPIRGDRYVFATPEGEWEFGVDDLDVRPATLAGALQRYSQGRCAVSLDRIAH